MKVGDVHNSNRKTVSFNTQYPIQEQLDNFTSMVYNMSVQKKGYNRPFKPQIHQKRRRGQNWQMFRDRDRNRSSSRDGVNCRRTMTKTSGKTIGDNHRIDKTIGEEIIDAKIMEPKMKIDIGVEIG